MRLSLHSQQFRAKKGPIIVFSSPKGESLYFSLDGKEYRLLIREAIRERRNGIELIVRDPYDNSITTLRRAGDVVQFNGYKFHRSRERKGNIDVVPLPFERVAVGLFGLGADTIIYVSSDRYHRSFDHCRAFIGSSNTLHRMVIDVRKRGDSLTMTSKGGVLHLPSNPGGFNVPRWNDIRLSVLPLSGLIISEEETTVRLERATSLQPTSSVAD